MSMDVGVFPPPRVSATAEAVPSGATRRSVASPRLAVRLPDTCSGMSMSVSTYRETAFSSPFRWTVPFSVYLPPASAAVKLL